MKNLYSSILIVIVALFLFAPLAVAKPPFWDDQVNNTGRFKVLSEFGNEGVFDKETGLVWGRVAGDTDGDGTADANDQKTWSNGHLYCNDKRLGGRKGWRLPTIQELASLVDTSNDPALPDDHPFLSAQSFFYWSATTSTFNTANAWVVNFNNGNVDTNVKSLTNFVWCVRGGQGVDPQ